MPFQLEYSGQRILGRQGYLVCKCYETQLQMKRTRLMTECTDQ